MTDDIDSQPAAPRSDGAASAPVPPPVPTPVAGRTRGTRPDDPVAKIRGAKKVRRRKLETAGLWLIAALAVLVVLGTVYAFVFSGPRTASGEPSTFVVRSGDGSSAVSQRLAKEGLVRSRLVYRVIEAVSAGGELKPGEYEIPSGASPGRIVDILTTGRGIQRKITIPEGWTVAMAMERIEKNPLLEGPMPTTVPAEGTMMPDTYPFQRGDTRAAMVERMVATSENFLAEAWLRRAADLPLRTPQEALILASIVEKETAIASERPQVASVFVNRLRRGMKLQSDPTIIYGITKGVPLRRRIRASEIRMPHPWNTYVINALPPTPIANPGRESIEAVLNPPDTPYIFFVADGTGGHVFAETYAEHNRNVQRWREFRARQEAKDADLAGGRDSGGGQ
ncbi:MAG: endolytic transglycosylase MltG [Hyphomonadaceae bacterium]|nr:endolytic transglycosylase MltG [Hyphomonadaceae bacterium]